MDASEYRWANEKVLSTSSTFSIESILSDVEIMVGDPTEWSVLPMLGEKRICSSFDDCMIPFSECLFTRIGLRLPFYPSKFEVFFLKNLKVVRSQLYLGS